MQHPKSSRLRRKCRVWGDTVSYLSTHNLSTKEQFECWAWCHCPCLEQRHRMINPQSWYRCTRQFVGVRRWPPPASVRKAVTHLLVKVLNQASFLSCLHSCLLQSKTVYPLCSPLPYVVVLWGHNATATATDDWAAWLITCFNVLFHWNSVVMMYVSLQFFIVSWLCGKSG